MHDTERPNASTATGRSTFTLSIRPDRMPSCPLCGYPLQPQITRIRDGFACCTRCSDAHPLDYGMIRLTYETGHLDTLWTQASGIRFWVPDHTPPYPMWSALRDLRPDLHPYDIRWAEDRRPPRLRTVCTDLDVPLH